MQYKVEKMNWPNDADGDVLRRLEQGGLDFSLEYDIDFMVDFESWPPSDEAVSKLREEFGNVEIYPPEEYAEGYLLFVVKHTPGYDIVIETQHRASNIVSPYGGICEAWGILH